MMSNRAFRRIRLSAVLAFICAAANLPASALCKEKSEKTTVAMLTGGFSAWEVEQLSQAMEAQLSDLSVYHQRLVTTALPQTRREQIDSALFAFDTQGARVVYWPVSKESGKLVVYLHDHDPPLVTRTLSGSGEGGLHDSAAIILRNIIRTYLAGEKVPVEKAQSDFESSFEPGNNRQPAAESPAPAKNLEAKKDLTKTKNSPSKNPTLHLLWAKVGYTTRTHSPQSPFLQGAVMAVGATFARHFRAGVSYEAITPARKTTEHLDLSLSLHPVTLVLQAQFPLGPFTLGGQIGPRMAIVKEEVTAKEDLREIGKRKELEWAAHGSMELAYPVNSWFAVFLSLGAEIILNRTEYATDLAQGETTIIEPWRLSGLGQIGLRASFL